jgi:hypothetical protein
VSAVSCGLRGVTGLACCGAGLAGPIAVDARHRLGLADRDGLVARADTTWLVAAGRRREERRGRGKLHGWEKGDVFSCRYERLVPPTATPLALHQGKQIRFQSSKSAALLQSNDALESAEVGAALTLSSLTQSHIGSSTRPTDFPQLIQRRHTRPAFRGRYRSCTWPNRQRGRDWRRSAAWQGQVNTMTSKYRKCNRKCTKMSEMHKDVGNAQR